jgi:hypothetical protein
MRLPVLRSSTALGLTALVAGLALACNGSESTPPPVAANGASAPTSSVAGLVFPVPPEWQAQAPRSSMRLAEYVVPGPAGEASLVIFRFPGGGNAKANIDRWVGQFSGADASNGGAGPKIETQEREGLVITSLDVSGDYAGQQMPGAPEQPAISNARLLALVVEGKGDPFFLKLQGPAGTVSVWTDEWSQVVSSIRVE